MKITPEEQKILDQAKLIADKTTNPESDGKKDEGGEGADENFEKRFKDTQSAFTKAQQDKVEMATMLVEADPANVERIPDEKVKAKVLQAKWGVDTMEELNAMFPNYKKVESDGGDDEMTEIERLQQTVKLMQFQGTKTKTNEEIVNLINNNKDIVATIPDFENKVREQMKNISETVLPKDRIDMAFKLVLSANSSSASAYGAMQGITGFSAGKDVKPESKQITSSMVTDIMSKKRM